MHEEEQARSNLAGMVNDIQFEVWAAHSVAQESREQVTALEKLVAAAEESRKLAEDNYSSGTGTILEVFEAQAGLASARLNLVQARLDWYLSVARLEKAVGYSVAGRAQPAGRGR